MYRIILLGGPRVVAPEGGTAPTLRRRLLALVALLATGRRTVLSRDQLLLYLWPESTPARGRHSLTQAVLELRRLLGEDAVVGTTELRLNEASFSCDLWDLEAALDAGEPERSASLYVAPFLAGFRLPGLDEFDSWVADERERVRARMVAALQAMAGTAEHERRFGDAAAAWRLLLREEPFSAEATLSTMRALRTAGEAAQALMIAASYEQRVRGELGAEPEPEVAELAAEIADDLRLDAHASDAPAPPGQARPKVAKIIAPPSALRRRGWMVAGVLAAVLMGATALLSLQARARSGSQDDRFLPVLVFPFADCDARDAGGRLAHALTQLFATELDDVDGIQVQVGECPGNETAGGGAGWVGSPSAAARLARRQGGRLFVLGEVVLDGDGRARAQTLLFEAGSGKARPFARVSVGAADRVQVLADSVTRRLLGAIALHLNGYPLDRSALEARSLPALRPFVEGEIALADGRFAASIEAFARAVEADSSFVLAYHRMGVAADRGGRPEVARAAAQQAVALSDRLPDGKRLLLRGVLAWRSGNPWEAERQLRRAVAEDPRDIEASFFLGEVLFRENPLRGRSVAEARPFFEAVLALDSTHSEALVRLARLLAMEGETGRARLLAARIRRLAARQPGGDDAAFRAFVLGDGPGLSRATREVMAEFPRGAAPSALEAALAPDGADGAEAFARRLLDASRSPVARAFALRLLAQMSYARGQVGRGESQLAEAEALDATAALRLRSLYAAFPLFGATREQLLEVRTAEEQWDASTAAADDASDDEGLDLQPLIRLQRLGVLSSALGDTVAAWAAVERLEASVDGPEWLASVSSTLAWSIRAHVFAERGDAAAALAALDSARWQRVGHTIGAEASDRFLRGELLARLGRDREALGWFGSIAERASYELVYRAPAELRQAQIFDRLGDGRAAVLHYDRFAASWRDCDPMLQPLVRHAMERTSVLRSAARSMSHPAGVTGSS